MNRLSLFLLLCILLGAPSLLSPIHACTSAVVSGKATPDGRPLLWKNRDTGHLLNHVAYVQGERYAFIANVNSDDFPARKEAWVGTNEAGFSLMNTQSYNLMAVSKNEERGEANGRIIYRALELCATLQEFCQLLDTLAKPSRIEANFGVIDAQGGAAILEVDYYGYKVYDANDPQVAPHGYVTRSNFSVSGQHGEGAGYVRFLEADRVLQEAAATRSITPQLIYDRLARSFRNPQLNIDLRSETFCRPGQEQWFVDQDFIPRHSTSCSVVVQGVKPGERAELTTMWTLLGYGPTGVALPLWVKGADRLLPAAVLYDEACGASPLSRHSRDLMERTFALHKGSGTDRYFCWSMLYNAEGTGFMQRLQPVEQRLFSLSQPLLERWQRQGRVDLKQLEKLYAQLTDALQPVWNLTSD